MPATPLNTALGVIDDIVLSKMLSAKNFKEFAVAIKAYNEISKEIAMSVSFTPKKQIQEQVPVSVKLAPPTLVAVSESKTIQLTAEQSAKVDEFVQLRKEVEEVKPQAKQADKLRKELQVIASEFPPLERVVLQGEYGECAFKGDAGDRVVTNVQGILKALKETIGYEATLKLIKFSIADLEKYLGEVELSKYVEYKEPTRTLDGYTVYENN